MSKLWIGAYVLIAIAFAVIFYVNGLRKDDQDRLVSCLYGQQVASALRTSALADATDRERAADLALIRGPASDQLRERAIAAREHTDRVRAEYPAPPVNPCR